MLRESPPLDLYSILLAAFILGAAAVLLKNKYGQGINEIPGPWLAPFTDLWRFLLVLGRRPELEHILFHPKYGNLVRLGPRMISVSSPAAIPVIYGLNAGFTKSAFYSVQGTVSKGTCTPDLVQHKRREVSCQATSSGE